MLKANYNAMTRYAKNSPSGLSHSEVKEMTSSQVILIVIYGPTGAIIAETGLSLDMFSIQLANLRFAGCEPQHSRCDMNASGWREAVGV